MMKKIEEKQTLLKNHKKSAKKYNKRLARNRAILIYLLIYAIFVAYR